jgi:DNA-binding response OmpR family regulator
VGREAGGFSAGPLLAAEENTMSQHTILVVDDEPAIVASLAYCLEMEGYRVLTASNGEDAARKILEVVPDLIISDIMMPGVDGYELCRRIRLYYKTRRVPFLFLTAKTAAESKLKGMKLGGDDYITKPFDLSELVLKVRRVLARTYPVSDPVV